MVKHDTLHIHRLRIYDIKSPLWTLDDIGYLFIIAMLLLYILWIVTDIEAIKLNITLL